jgi:hypothetical protein
MKKISENEKGLFLSLFNRDGYVLDFNTNDFDNFTFASIGVPLCEQYEMSKGKSLIAYCNVANEYSVIKLLVDLYEHYEFSRLIIYDQDIRPEYYSMYTKLKPIVEKLKPLIDVSISEVLLKPIKEIFGSDYITAQIEAMIALESSNPTDCIGKAKELIESCCITILEKLNVARDKKWDLNRLMSETTNHLNLSPKKINETIALSGTIKQILQSLRNIASGMSELRNPYGSGHGKSATFKGLETRHARLAIGAAATLVNFLWDSYLLQFGQK